MKQRAEAVKQTAKEFSVESHLCKHIDYADRIIFYIFAVFSIWYWLECVYLVYTGHGIYLTFLYASEVFYDFYFTLLTGYAVLTLFYKRRRWGHMFVALWVGTWIGVVWFGLHTPIGEAQRALIDKAAGMVVLIYFVRYSGKVVFNRDEHKKEESCT
ncbi:MAG: hypothetical protein Q8O83_01470 [bacterium]|nr:hypothetical protein [bacterium]